MQVKDLISVLEDVDPSATIKLYAEQQPQASSGSAEGSIALVAITTVDNVDKVVVLSNCVADDKGNAVFDAPPQVKRFRISTNDGIRSAINDLTSKVNSEPTHSLEVHKQVMQVKRLFRNLEKEAGDKRKNRQ